MTRGGISKVRSPVRSQTRVPLTQRFFPLEGMGDALRRRQNRG